MTALINQTTSQMENSWSPSQLETGSEKRTLLLTLNTFLSWFAVICDHHPVKYAGSSDLFVRFICMFVCLIKIFLITTFINLPTTFFNSTFFHFNNTSCFFLTGWSQLWIHVYLHISHSLELFYSKFTPNLH